MTTETSGPNQSAAHWSGWLAADIRELERDPEYVAEKLALEVTEQALQLMQERGIARTRLAEIMGTSRAYVTKLLNAPPNLTLHSIARLALALGATPNLLLVPGAHTVAAPVPLTSDVAIPLPENVQRPDASRNVSSALDETGPSMAEMDLAVVA